MSHQEPHRPEDPVNAEAQDWDEAGVPEQEDTTEDEALPGERGDPTVLDEEYDSSTEERDPLEDALDREEPEAPEALGSAAPDRGRAPAGGGEEPAPRVVEPGPGGPEGGEGDATADPAPAADPSKGPEEQALRQEDEGGRPGE